MMVILMGPAGVGKTTVGQCLAAQLHWVFVEGDAFHPAANIAKMRRGQPLTDSDRAPWLAALRVEMAHRHQAGQSAVVACSALKQQYRAQLQWGQSGPVQFVYLRATAALLRSRLTQRPGHFMAVTMLTSQLAALEAPTATDAWVVDAGQSVAAIVAQIEDLLSRHFPAE